MDANQHLYYGFGQVSYAVAMADGHIQDEEKVKFKQIVAECINKCDVDFDYAEIIFQVLDRQQDFTQDHYYSNGMHNIYLGEQHLSENIKIEFTKSLMEIAEAFPPYEVSEMNILHQFKQDIENLEEFS